MAPDVAHSGIRGHPLFEHDQDTTSTLESHTPRIAPVLAEVRSGETGNLTDTVGALD